MEQFLIQAKYAYFTKEDPVLSQFLKFVAQKGQEESIQNSALTALEKFQNNLSTNVNK